MGCWRCVGSSRRSKTNLDAVLEERRRAVLDGWVRAIDRLAEARAEEGARLAAVLRGQLAELACLVEAGGGMRGSSGRRRSASGCRRCWRASPISSRNLEKTGLRRRWRCSLLGRTFARNSSRLRAHIEQAAEFCSRQDEAVGRRLDFLCQELNREANTLCSKSADIELTRVGLSLKAAVEQFREQVQNIE